MNTLMKTILTAASAAILLLPTVSQASPHMCDGHTEDVDVCTPYEVWGSNAYPSCNTSQWSELPSYDWCVDSDSSSTVYLPNSTGGCDSHNYETYTLQSCEWGSLNQNRDGSWDLECYTYLEDVGGTTCAAVTEELYCFITDENGNIVGHGHFVNGVCMADKKPPCDCDCG